MESLLVWLLRNQELLVQALLHDGAANMTRQLPGATFAAWRSPAPTTGYVNLTLEGTNGAVSWHVGGTLGQLQEKGAVATAAVLEPELASVVGIPAALDFNLFDLQGRRVPVDSVDKPFLVQLPLKRAQNVSCSFWDTEAGDFSSRGLNEVLGLEGWLTCSSTHLTFFAALIQAFVNAFLCSQIGLFSGDALGELFKGDWWKQPVSLLFWLLLLLMLVLLGLAGLLDWLRGEKMGDEAFLIPRLREKPADEEEFTFTRTVSSAQQARASLAEWASWCWSSSVVKDAVDEIASRWFKHFSELRNLGEQIWESLQCSEHSASSALEVLVSALVTSSVRRQVSASTGMSEDDVATILEDPKLQPLLLEGAVLNYRGASETPWERQLKAWHSSHEAVVKHFRSHWQGTGWCSLPQAFARIFLAANPFSAVFLSGRSMCCRLRLLFFAVELFGSLMLATLFFEASGVVPNKRTPEDCLDGGDSIAEEIGRILAVGTCSLVVASLPASLLASLHVREFKKVPYAGCPEWTKQLQSWRMQDRFAWILGSLYIAFCILFISVFLANVATQELPSWGASGGTALLQDALVVPVAVALVVPLLSQLFLGLASLVLAEGHAHLLQRKLEELECNGVNCREIVVAI